MRMKVKNRSHRYDINRTRARCGYEYMKHKMCLSVMMVMCISKTEAKSETEFMKKEKNKKTLRLGCKFYCL